VTPRLTAALIGGAILLAGAAGLYWKGRLEGAARERPKVEAAFAKAAVASLEVRGERESSVRAEAAVRAGELAARSVTHVTQGALKARDANAPLDPDRIRRLRAHDERLCLSAELAGCAAAGDAAAGAKAVRAAPAARRANHL
jgi:hypothetical protein